MALGLANERVVRERKGIQVRFYQARFWQPAGLAFGTFKTRSKFYCRNDASLVQRINGINEFLPEQVCNLLFLITDN
jgi:hypothetical protein